MGFFSTLFHTDRKKKRSVVLIDIDARSVAGAYARHTEGEKPALLYTQRLLVEPHEGEEPTSAMLRTLDSLGGELIREGAPTLLRATGSGRADVVFVSVGGPWQETSARTERFERDTPFVFTRNMLARALEKTRIVPPGKALVDESVVGALANGYRTRDPYDKRVRHASVVVLTSLLDADIADRVIEALRDLYHAERVRLIATRSLCYQAMRAAFPHGPEPDISSFGLALAAAEEGKLWLSNDPSKNIPVHTGHLAGLVQHAAPTSPDLHLSLMALFHRYHAPEEKI